MGSEPGAAAPLALAPLDPGPLVTIAAGRLRVDIAPAAGGRIAQVFHDGVEQLVGPGDGDTAAIAWGCYPMVPWAGRIHRGRFRFGGRGYQLPLNLDGHAIHGIGFVLPWRLERRSDTHAELSLALPRDRRWPFGGAVRQAIRIDGGRLLMRLSVTAGDLAMPLVTGWHPWFRKPDRVAFSPVAIHPRRGGRIAPRPRPISLPPPGPWDDCFIVRGPLVLHRGGQALRLTSGHHHWVLYDEPAHATCIEPQSGPPDGFNLAPEVLAPGARTVAWFALEWL